MKAILLFALITLFVTCTATLARSGDLDSTFGVNGVVRFNVGTTRDYGCSSVIQPDGKILIAGSYDNYYLNQNFILIRYNPDGTLDKTFNDSGIVRTETGKFLDWGFRETDGVSIALQNDGKIIVAGDSYIGGGIGRSVIFTLIRYLHDGRIDSSFGINGFVRTNISDSYDEIFSLILQNDGKIIVAGASDYQKKYWKFDIALARYLPDGTLDSTFGHEGIVITKIDTLESKAAYILLQPDGKIIIGAYIQNANKIRNSILIRYNNLGFIDSTFGLNGILKLDYNIIYLGFDNNYKEIEIGFRSSINGIGHYLLDGTLNKSFGKNGILLFETPKLDSKLLLINSLVIESNGKIILTGRLDTNLILIRYNEDGTLDNTFGVDGIVISTGGTGRNLHLQKENRIILIGVTLGYQYINYQLILTQYYSSFEAGINDNLIKNNYAFSYPNPIKNEATINYTLLKDDLISIDLFDLTGRIIKTYLKNQLKPIGNNTERLTFDFIQSGNYILIIQNCSKINSIKIEKE